MSGEGFLPCNGKAVPAANEPRVGELRQLADQLRVMLGDGVVNASITRRAANELSELADAMEGGGGLAKGYAAVPLFDAAVLPSPVPPPPLSPPGGDGGTPNEACEA